MAKQEKTNVAVNLDTKELIEVLKAKKFLKDKKKMSVDEFLKEILLRENEKKD